jgi:hypothetical protein
MKRKRFSVEQIVVILKQAKLGLSVLAKTVYSMTIKLLWGRRRGRARPPRQFVLHRTR